MSECRWPVWLGVAVCVPSLAARAELPSLMTDTAVMQAGSAEQGGRPAKQLMDYASLGERSVRVRTLGSVDYRFAGKGLKTSFAYRDVSVNTSLGYNGKHRFEFDWRSQGSDLKLAFTVDDSNGEYRIDFVRNF